MISTKNLSGLPDVNRLKAFCKGACSFGHHHVREGMEFHPSLYIQSHMEKGKRNILGYRWQ